MHLMLTAIPISRKQYVILADLNFLLVLNTNYILPRTSYPRTYLVPFPTADYWSNLRFRLSTEKYLSSTHSLRVNP